MSDQLATDIRGIVDGGAPPITLAELELASLTGTPPRRHRRWPVLAAAAAVAALIVATIILVRTASNDGGTVQTPAGPAPSAPAPAPPAPAPAPPAPAATPLGAPLVEGPDAASTLLASWGQIHVGYVFVYADGRVIWGGLGAGMFIDADNRVTGIALAPVGPLGSGPTTARFWLTESGLEPGLTPGGSARFPEGEFGYRIIERRLSARGLDLVREGEITVEDLLVQPDEQWPAEITDDLSRWPVAIQLALRPELWAEPTTRVWEPATYALCPYSNIPGPGPTENLDATDVVDELPAPIQAVLDGKQRTYDPSIGTAEWEFEFVAPGTLTDCFEVTAAEASTLYEMLDANGQIFEKGYPNAQGWDGVFVYGRVSFSPTPIFPHGQHVIFGG